MGAVAPKAASVLTLLQEKEGNRVEVAITSGRWLVLVRIPMKPSWKRGMLARRPLRCSKIATFSTDLHEIYDHIARRVLIRKHPSFSTQPVIGIRQRRWRRTSFSCYVDCAGEMRSLRFISQISVSGDYRRSVATATDPVIDHPAARPRRTTTVA